jgi:HAD superfamily hydrolase (TIGR01450 family)
VFLADDLGKRLRSVTAIEGLVCHERLSLDVAVAVPGGVSPYDRQVPAGSEETGRPDAFAIDLDGVVWLSREPIDGSIEALRILRESGRPLVFVTNDPRSTRAELAARLTELGAPTDAGEIVTSARAAAHALAEEHPGARVLSVGTPSLDRELFELGLDPLGPDHEAAAEPGAVAAVVVGGGGRFDFDVLRIAAAAARGGAELWATNKDPTYPTANGLVPGTGAIVAAIEVASGTAARNVGKPESALFADAVGLLGVPPQRALMAGDSLHSDIAGAARAGLATALILTGRDAREDIASAPVKPELVFPDLAALAAAL